MLRKFPGWQRILRNMTTAICLAGLLLSCSWIASSDLRQFMEFQAQHGQLSLLHLTLREYIDVNNSLPARVCGDINDMSWRGRLSAGVPSHGFVPDGFPNIALVADDDGFWCSSLSMSELHGQFRNSMIFLYVPVQLARRHKYVERIQWSNDSHEINVWSHDSPPTTYPVSILRNTIGLRLYGTRVHIQLHASDDEILSVLNGTACE